MTRHSYDELVEQARRHMNTDAGDDELAQWNQFLDEGAEMAHPQDGCIDEIWGFLRLGRQAIGPQVDPFFRSLIAHGANPLKPGGFDKTLLEQETSVAATVFEAVIEQEIQGNYLRADDGSNPLHLVADLSTSFLSDRSDHFFSRRLLDIGWLNEARSVDGNTPLHCLWSDGNLRIIQPSPSRTEILWRTTALFLKNGADVYIENEKGHTVASLISEALEAGLRVPSDECEQILSRIQAEKEKNSLDETTPFTGKISRRSRL